MKSDPQASRTDSLLLAQCHSIAQAGLIQAIYYPQVVLEFVVDVADA